MLETMLECQAVRPIVFNMMYIIIGTGHFFSAAGEEGVDYGGSTWWREAKAARLVRRAHN
jgi:hypothetical protein